MTLAELKIAKKLLDSRCDRMESCPVDGGGYCLTAHWRDGGQRLFYTLEDVRRHVNEH